MLFTFVHSKLSQKIPTPHFLDLHISTSHGFVRTKIYDKLDDFDFDIVNFPILVGDGPRSTFCGVYIFQLIRFARVSSHADDFILVIKF